MDVSDYSDGVVEFQPRGKLNLTTARHGFLNQGSSLRVHDTSKHHS